MAGASTVYGAGMLELGMSLSLEQMVIDNDIIGMNKYAAKGIEVNDKTLAVETIESVGAGNDFLGLEETMMNVGLPSHPLIIDRRMIGLWQTDGSKDLAEAAHDRVLHILENHRPEPLDEKAAKRIDEIIKKADREHFKR